MGGGRLVLKVDRRREVGLENRWEVKLAGGGLSALVGGWPQKRVGAGNLAPKTGGSWEVGTPATTFLVGIAVVGPTGPRCAPKQSGAVEACWAHNPEVRGSKPRSANVYVCAMWVPVT